MGEPSDNSSIEAAKIARDSMERYSGSHISCFGEYLLITNFPRYVDYFATSRDVKIFEGSSFKVAHSKKENISILDFKMGSPMAALVVDLCAYLPIKGVVMLGMAGGLRDRFKIGDYFIPVGSIRGDGTSDFYFPPEVPALANFVVQRVLTDELESLGVNYHLGITHTTNRRFWEFNEEFKHHILLTRPQVIEMECATLFIASYKHKVPLGALLLISDLPLRADGIKTRSSADHVFNTYTQNHVEHGIAVLKRLENWQNSHHYYNRFEDENSPTPLNKAKDEIKENFKSKMDTKNFQESKSKKRVSNTKKSIKGRPKSRSKIKSISPKILLEEKNSAKK